MPDEKQLREKQQKDEDRLKEAFGTPETEGGSTNEPANEPAKKDKKPLIMLIAGIIMLIGGGVMIALPYILPKESLPDLVFPTIPSTGDTGKQVFYSDITGLEVSNESSKISPVFCVQTPNGNDGARPHSGLTDAGVIFEAIAEAGITRFAAIYQNPTQAVIGPIRSLRTYYLDWDTPFDCVITHAGGAPDALEAVKNGYKDLTENYTYMYRGTYGVRLWNNLFTTSNYLSQAASDHGWNTSNVKGFSRMTPGESTKNRIDSTAKEVLNITKATDANTSSFAPSTTHIEIDMAGSPTFDVIYDYDADSNTYKRSYGNGEAHNVYKCPTENLGEKNPEDVCELTQMSPAVVIAMEVQERRASDGYHENITTVGSGDAYIFQNGIAIEGTWKKSSVESQIEFTDKNGKEIKLAPGQTFITAVPNYGSIDY